MSKQKAMYWPYGIALSFVLIIALIIGTIVVASNNAVEPSDSYMSHYHDIDARYNEIKKAEFAFNARYDLAYATNSFKENNTVVAYKIMDKAGKAVNDASIKVIVTRPNTHAFNIELNDPMVENGVYTFDKITLPKTGRWNVMAHVKIGDDERFCNIKTDTRYTNQANLTCEL